MNVAMEGPNVKVKFLSLNVCGFRDYFNRKKMFKYLQDKRFISYSYGHQDYVSNVNIIPSVSTNE